LARWRHFHSVDCRRNSPGRLPLSNDFYGMADVVFVPPSRRKAAQPRPARHFGGMEPMHSAAALDSKGMAAAVARGSR
jgi:hypothetical protein